MSPSDKDGKSPSAQNKSGGMPRRDFLVLLGASGAAAALVACTPKIPNPTSTSSSNQTSTSMPPTSIAPSFDAQQYFDARQAAIVHAAAGRIIPGTDQDPGAKEAAVVVFIDGALAGYDSALQPQYIAGIEGMDAYASGKYNKGFASITDQQQDDILSNMEKNSDEARKYLPGAGAFFAILLNHVRQGMFADPVWGGNRNAVGWKLEGHPGIVFGRATTEQKCDVDFPKEYMGDKEYYATHPG
jgi:gluconate 2-dehydrogenase gamma chain